MSDIQNTTDFVRNGGAYLILAEAMGGATNDQIIGRMESDGQRQIVNSSALPTELGRNETDADYEAIGFTFGDPVQGDAMFRNATLPDRWRRQGSEHAMWSHLVDEHGRDRVAIFYKAAFYDRRAFMRLETPYGHLKELLREGNAPILDDEWLTPTVVAASLVDIHDEAMKMASEAEGFATGRSDTYWLERKAEHEAEAAKAESLRARISGAS